MWNAKVKCKKVWSTIDTRGFEVDKIYNVVNGKLILPNGEESCLDFDCIEKLNESFYATFEEVDK